MFDSLHNQNFALIRRAEDNGILFFKGDVREVESIRDIQPNTSPNSLTHATLPTLPNGVKHHLKCLALLPFAQIKERGFVAHDDKAPLVVMDIEHAEKFSEQELFAVLPASEPLVFSKKITLDLSDKEYEAVISKVISDEIGNGEGANFVIPRVGRAKIDEMNLAKALTIFKNLLVNEKGTYWTYLFKFNDSYLIGATPERHVTYENGVVKMNPISGTYRKNEAPTDSILASKHLRDFLQEKKEINELFMVVDEELKQMARICRSGGTISGPLLKNMSRLVHTEYLLSGRSDGTIEEVLRESMFAATVSGSPIESACRVIKKYEPEARRYYGSALVLSGNSADGSPYMDSPIPIRTVEISKEGDVLFRVGGTLVRDSVPEQERLETDAKFAGMVASMHGSKTPNYAHVDVNLECSESQKILAERNASLSQFWFYDQEHVDHKVPAVLGKRITVIENEDDFAYMLAHMMRAMGATVDVVKFNQFDTTKNNSDLVVVGPGPGNPTDGSQKMQTLDAILSGFLDEQRPFLSVCLGHQLLCQKLGLPIVRKEDPQQGVAKNIELFGERVRVGFYNTFAANNMEFENDSIAVAAEANGEVNAIKGSHFYGVQFHPESILSKDGLAVLGRLLTELL